MGCCYKFGFNLAKRQVFVNENLKLGLLGGINLKNLGFMLAKRRSLRQAQTTRLVSHWVGAISLGLIKRLRFAGISWSTIQLYY